MVICQEQVADLHMAQLMPLPLTVSCVSKIQIGFTFLVPAHLGSPGHRAVKRVSVYALFLGFLHLLTKILFWKHFGSNSCNRTEIINAFVNSTKKIGVVCTMLLLHCVQLRM